MLSIGILRSLVCPYKKAFIYHILYGGVLELKASLLPNIWVDLFGFADKLTDQLFAEPLEGQKYAYSLTFITLLEKDCFAASKHIFFC